MYNRMASAVVALLIVNPFSNAFQDFQSSVDEEEYAVYSAFINTAMTSPNRQLFVIKEQRVTWHLESGFLEREHSRQQLALLAQETVDNYNARNQEIRELLKSRVLSRSFNLKLPYAFLTREEERQIFGPPYKVAEERWEVFEQKFPGSSGHIALSPVGFNYARDQALLYAESTCKGGYCFSKNLYVLAKAGGLWEIREWLVLSAGSV